MGGGRRRCFIGRSGRWVSRDASDWCAILCAICILRRPWSRRTGSRRRLVNRCRWIGASFAGAVIRYRPLWPRWVFPGSVVVSERFEILRDCHEQAFDFFGGSQGSAVRQPAHGSDPAGCLWNRSAPVSSRLMGSGPALWFYSPTMPTLPGPDPGQACGRLYEQLLREGAL